MLSLAAAWLLATGGATLLLLAAMFAPEAPKCKRKRKKPIKWRCPPRRQLPRRACKFTREEPESEEEADEEESEEEESEQEE